MRHYFATRDQAVTKREIEHQALSRQMAGECMVLLENDGALPITDGTSLALFGNGARNTVKGGTGSGDVNSRDIVNIERGLEDAGFKITTKDWLTRQEAYSVESKENYLKWVSRKAEEDGMTEFMVTFAHPFQVVAPLDISREDIDSSKTDTAVYVIARNSGEGVDRYDKRGDYLLYEKELEQIKILGSAYKKLIIVLNVGGVWIPLNSGP